MKCGAARVEITPPFATALFGYPGVERVFEPHRDRMLDPLQARVVYLESGGAPGILLVSLDLCILLDPDADHLRARLAAHLGLPVEHVLVACTHTHSGPLARLVPPGKQTRPEDGFIIDTEATGLKYGAWMLERILKVAGEAVARKAPVEIAFRETRSGLGYDRRCRTPEGIRNCWNLQEFPDRHPQPARDAVHAVLSLGWRNKPGGVLLQSAGIHPVVMGKTSNLVSADWPGHARRHIERRLPRQQAVFFQGAAAQVQPWFSTQADPRALRLVGEAAGAEAVLLALNGHPVSVPYGPLQPRHLRVAGTGATVAAVSLGEVLVLALPLELSTSVAMEIRTLLNRPVFMICLANGWHGYWMSAAEFDEGGYEVEVARSKGFGPEASRALVDCLKPLAL